MSLLDCYRNVKQSAVETNLLGGLQLSEAVSALFSNAGQKQCLCGGKQLMP